jgi:hypothetical protein
MQAVSNPLDAIINNLSIMDPLKAGVDFDKSDHMTNLSKPGWMQDIRPEMSKERLNEGQGKGLGQYAAPIIGGLAAAINPYMGAGMAVAMKAGEAAQGDISWEDFAKGAIVDVGGAFIPGISGTVGAGLSKGIGGTAGMITGAVGKAATGTALKTGLQAAVGQDVSLEDALIGTATSAGLNIAGTVGTGMLADTKVGELFGVDKPVEMPIPTDVTGEDLGIMDRMKAGFSQVGQDILSTFDFDPSTISTYQQQQIEAGRVAEPSTKIAPSALELGASPGDITAAGEGGIITASGQDLARLAETDLGYGVGAGFEGGEYRSTHTQEGLLAGQEPTGPDLIGAEYAEVTPQSGSIQSPTGADSLQAADVGSLDIPTPTEVTGGVVPLSAQPASIEELGGPYRQMGEEYRETPLKSPFEEMTQPKELSGTETLARVATGQGLVDPQTGAFEKLPGLTDPLVSAGISPSEPTLGMEDEPIGQTMPLKTLDPTKLISPLVNMLSGTPDRDRYITGRQAELTGVTDVEQEDPYSQLQFAGTGRIQGEAIQGNLGIAEQMAAAPTMASTFDRAVPSGAFDAATEAERRRRQQLWFNPEV